MEDISNILILIFTFTLTIIPFTGKLWSKKSKNRKFYKRGVFFIFLAFVTVVLGIIQISQDTNNQAKRDVSQANTLFNTERIMDSLENSMGKIEARLIRIDSLNFKLDSLEVKTIATINKRDKILSDFKKLNNQLKRLYTQEDLKLKENIPVVNILENVKWVKGKNIYEIVILFTNSGERVAKDMNVQTCFYETNERGNIINHRLLSDDLPNGREVPSNKVLRHFYPNYPKSISSDTMTTGYIMVEYSYRDFISDSVYHKKDGFIWRGIKADNLTWISMPLSVSKNIDQYLSKIKLNKVAQDNHISL